MVTTTHKLITPSWKADVQAVESGIARFALDRRLWNDCEVALFQIAGDGHLHVNVTHRHQTATVRGWAGPGRLAQGFVHNRRFGDTPPTQVVRHIRDMVFAERA
jgi:hypothetical protein